VPVGLSYCVHLTNGGALAKRQIFMHQSANRLIEKA
jgi:hypothetical protein